MSDKVLKWADEEGGAATPIRRRRQTRVDERLDEWLDG